MKRFNVFLLLLLLVVGNVQSKMKLSIDVIVIEVNKTDTFQLSISVPKEGFVKNITFTCDDEDLVEVLSEPLIVGPNNTADFQVYNVQLKFLNAGKSGVLITSTTLDLSSSFKTTETVFLITEVYKSAALYYFSHILGWGYFIAWSISFYPQIYINYKRHSVEGVSLDFNWLNLYGYFTYNAFNMGMYFSAIVWNYYLFPWRCENYQQKLRISMERTNNSEITEVDLLEQFALRYPRTINPVHLNDIVFSLHSLVVTTIVVVQSYCYENGGQSVSKIAAIVLMFYFLVCYFLVLLALGNILIWLDVLYGWSYVKLSICGTKWVPQMYMNYKRQSTHGCSMGSIIIDFVGGILGILQMVFDSLNYDDWNCIIGNPTKVGLGIISILFDVGFILQHYYTYDHGFRRRRKNTSVEADAHERSGCENATFTTIDETNHQPSEFTAASVEQNNLNLENQLDAESIVNSEENNCVYEANQDEVRDGDNIYSVTATYI